MSRQQLHRLSWGFGALAAVAVVAAVVWCFSSGSHPQAAGQVAAEEPARRLEPYDLAAINADRSYYGKVVPERFFQIAPFPAGKTRHDEEIKIIGHGFRLTVPGAEEVLVIAVKPGRPITLIAHDGGSFVANGAQSITVKADAEGLASVAFRVGDVGDYRVGAASPENHGQAEFILQCVTAQEREDIRSGRHAERHADEQKAVQDQRNKAAAALAERLGQK
jgi:hypothetical protein